MLPLGLSYDHRVIDGAAAARFTVDLVQGFENFNEEDVKTMSARDAGVRECWSDGTARDSTAVLGTLRHSNTPTLHHLQFLPWTQSRLKS